MSEIIKNETENQNENDVPVVPEKKPGILKRIGTSLINSEEKTEAKKAEKKAKREAKKAAKESEEKKKIPVAAKIAGVGVGLAAVGGAVFTVMKKRAAAEEEDPCECEGEPDDFPTESDSEMSEGESPEEN